MSRLLDLIIKAKLAPELRKDLLNEIKTSKYIKLHLKIHPDTLGFYMHQAIEEGLLSVVTFLLTQDIDFNVKDKNGISAWHWAAAYGNETIVQLFLDNGADVNAIDSHGESALHKAAKGDHENTVKLLLNKGANIEGTYGDGIPGSLGLRMRLLGSHMTPLHVASQEGKEKIVDLLLLNGAEIEATDLRGHTALHHAVLKGHEKLVNFLFDNKANIMARDKYGNTLLHNAVVSYNIKVVDYLLGITWMQDTLGAINHDKKTAQDLANNDRNCPKEIRAAFTETAKLVKHIDSIPTFD